MCKRVVAVLLAWSIFGIARAADPVDVAALSRAFAEPPPTARPWVYWTWIDGNINKEGITADLEAMNRVGIGGALILDVSQSTPHGPVKFLDAQWQALFKHTVAEAKRLGMEININDGPGYYGSGGTWVTPAQGMQVVVQSETHITGGTQYTGKLALPSRNQEYKDIAVVAVGETAKARYQIPDLVNKAVRWNGWVAYRGTQSAPLSLAAPAEALIKMERVIELTGKMAPDGTLTWDAPAGEWTILRFGHQWNGRTVGPSVATETGPETDKLDKAVTAMHFDAFVKRLNDLVGPDLKDALVATHIDSWEGGGQNWTPALRDEFKKRRGYDPIPYLPVLAGRVLGDLQLSERFLFDLRLTISEMMIQNYSAEFQRLAHAAGLRNTYESYTTIGNDLDNAMFADEPMAEFWTPNGQGLDFQPTVKSMSSAAHLNGYSVVGAEAFTSGNQEKFMWTPARIKRIGDNAFIGGVNRFVFHRYAAQPFADAVKPGMQMGPWGLHYERTNTWWEFSGPWHKYLARCQYLLRQGTFVGDVLKLQSEEPLLRFQDGPITGYDFDACGPATFLRATTADGKIAFPSGAGYRLILLPDTPTMTVPLLARIRDLIRDGAALLGNPPQKTPGLTDYPRADGELKKLTDEIWGAEASVTDRSLGKGRVFRGMTPERALAALGVPPDFTSDADIKYIHRNVGSADVYFLSHPGDAAVIANCAFRTIGKTPQLWDAQTGRIVPLPAYAAGDRTTSLAIPFDPSGSAFIVFQRTVAPATSPLVAISRDGAAILADARRPSNSGDSPIDLLTYEFRQGGTYTFTSVNGASSRFSIPPLPAPVTVSGPWQLKFPAGWGAPPEVTLDRLISWSQHPDSGVKYFSGTAAYSKSLTLPALAPNQRLYLDLGNVQVMARVRLNGQNLGILWKPPYRVDITPAAKSGANALEIDVVNLWVNRLIGDEQLPEDSDRNTNGTLKSWPQWLLDGKPSPAGRLTFSSWRLWKKADPLVDSGLLGPVTLSTVQRMEP